MFTKWLSRRSAASRQAAAGRIGRRRSRGQRPRRLAMERLEDRLALAAMTATFDFEEFQESTINGAFTQLWMQRPELMAIVERPESRFDIAFVGVPSLDEVKSFGKRWLSPFYDQESVAPFVITFSEPLLAATVAMGDYSWCFGGDSDTLVVEAFESTLACGEPLSTATAFLPRTFPKVVEFGFRNLKVTAPVDSDGIRSLRILGGSTEYPSSTYVDNIQVRYGTPDIKLLDATCKVGDLRAIKVKYSISGNDVPKGFVFRAYLSEDAQFDTGDTLLKGELSISKAALRKAGDNGAEKVYTKTLTLRERPPLSKTSRFMIVVADANGQICEKDENNNAMFVIPLFKGGNFAGYDLNTGMFKGKLAQLEAVLPIGSRISRGTAEYEDLLGSPANNIKNLWTGIGGTFPLEDEAPFAGDDWTVQQTLVEPLRKFTELINLAKEQKRLDAPTLWITDAFDENSGHSDNSLHYEGRAIDFDTAKTSALGRLAGLATLAGFDWVNHEGNHFHVSHGGKQTAASAASILAALNFGNESTPRLVTSDETYADLCGPMSVIEDTMWEAGGDPLTPEQKEVVSIELKQFIKKAKAAQARNKILPGFAKGKEKTAGETGLLVYNAERLRKQLGIGP